MAIDTKSTNNSSAVPERHYTVQEVASIYGVSPRTVRNWVDEKALRGWRKGRLIRIPQSALAEFDRTR